MSDTTKDAVPDLTRAEFRRACTLLPPEFVWGLPVTPRLVLDVAEATLLSASKPAAPMGYVLVEEADFVPHVHPQYGSGVFCTEDCLNKLAASPAAPAQSAEPISDDHARTLWSLARMVSSTDWIKEFRKSLYAAPQPSPTAVVLDERGQDK